MPYLINKSDGTILATVADGQIDQLSTDLTLIGKNYSGFGEAINENFVKLLENFASVSRPARPTRGQIWFDVTELKLKVYNGTAFQPVSSATISPQQPTTLTPGDLWFNDTDKQLYFYDGLTTLLLGPSYATSQGLSGIQVDTILDTLNQNKVVTKLYNNSTLVGIFSTNTNEFTPKIPISGFSGSIVAGFNPGNIEGFKFNVTATRAENIIRPNGTVKSANQVLYNDESGIVQGQLGITGGVEIGTAQQVKLLEVNGDTLLQNVSDSKFTKISVRRGARQEEAMVIEPATQTVKFYEGYTSSEMLVGGNMTINGDLTVLGERVYVDIADLRVENKNIELGTKSDSTTLTDLEANNGGIILRGDTDKEFLWNLNRDAWTSNQSISLEGNKYFAIDGVPLLQKVGDRYQLMDAVTRAPGLEVFGVQAEWTVDNVKIDGNSVAALSGNLELAPADNVALIGSPRITGLAEPVDSSDAANKSYVDSEIRAQSLAFSLDISDGISNTGIAELMEQMFPVSEYQNGTIVRVLCTSTTLLDTTIFGTTLNATLNESTDTFVTPGPSTADALIDVNFSDLVIPGPGVNISRLIKTFQIIGSLWTFVS